MTLSAWLAVSALVGGAAVLGWPARRRALPGAGGAGPAALRARITALGRAAGGTGQRHPRPTILAAALTGAVTGGLAGGPVLGATAAGYAALATRAALRRASARAEAAARARVLDDLSAIAADLRAGLPPAAVLPTSHEATSARAAAERVQRLTGAVWRLAERTGAPAADLVERIEADARAADRAHATAAAQAAGARATALLLAALPAGGIALGYAIGADPLAVLLHTPLGAACALGALVLQVAGLAWSDRLAAAGTTP
jgi:tight adherence protein B